MNTVLYQKLKEVYYLHQENGEPSRETREEQKMYEIILKLLTDDKPFNLTLLQ